MTEIEGVTRHVIETIRYLKCIEDFTERSTRYSRKEMEEAKWRTPIADIEQMDNGAWGRAQPNSSQKQAYHDLINYEQLYPTSKQMTRRILERQRFDNRMGVVTLATTGRRPFLTSTGHIGICPKQTLVGDLIILFNGVEMPFVVRRVHLGYRLIGECYVHGIMDRQFVLGKGEHDFEFFPLS